MATVADDDAHKNADAGVEEKLLKENGDHLQINDADTKKEEKHEDEDGKKEPAEEDKKKKEDEADKKTPTKKLKREMMKEKSPIGEPPEKDDAEPKKKRAKEERKEKDEESKKETLFDSPLVVEGKRARHAVDRLAVLPSSTHRDKHEAMQAEGSGVKLADIEYVTEMISRTKPDDLKPLHRLLFARPGTPHEIRKNIRQFNGFPFGIGTPDADKKKAALEKLTNGDLRLIATVLGTDKSAKKEELVVHILDFLLKPTDKGRTVPGSKKRAAAKRKRVAKAPKSPSKKKNAKKSDAPESDSHSEDDEDHEAEATPPAKKAKPTPKKSVKKTPVASETSTPPTDAALTSLIKELLKGADLEQVTMKEMCKKVYDKYPSLDLTNRKDFIKSTVKEIISAGVDL